MNKDAAKEALKDITLRSAGKVEPLLQLFLEVIEDKEFTADAFGDWGRKYCTITETDVPDELKNNHATGKFLRANSKAGKSAQLSFVGTYGNRGVFMAKKAQSDALSDFGLKIERTNLSTTDSREPPDGN